MANGDSIVVQLEFIFKHLINAKYVDSQFRYVVYVVPCNVKLNAINLSNFTIYIAKFLRYNR
jgi:uncharacterized membrane protein